ncbi:hypothetical protein D3C81_2308890 [compost metagenome]
MEPPVVATFAQMERCIEICHIRQKRHIEIAVESIGHLQRHAATLKLHRIDTIRLVVQIAQ